MSTLQYQPTVETLGDYLRQHAASLPPALAVQVVRLADKIAEGMDAGAALGALATLQRICRHASDAINAAAVKEAA